MSPDLYSGETTRWAYELLVGAGFAAFFAALVRELFDLFGGV